MVVRRLWPDSPDVVLSGHTHTIAYSRHENSFGGFSEFTGNSVWKAPEIATAEPIGADAMKYALDVAADGVSLEFYPGAALAPARTFKLK